MTKEEAINVQHRCLDLQYQLDDAYAEIEQLRADLQACGSYVGIGPNEGDLPVPERVRRCVSRLNGSIGHYDQKLIARAAKITELEAALVEERARGNHYGMSYEEAVSPDPIERWIINGEIDAPKIYIDRVRDEARRQLVTEGKIGTGNHIVKTNQMVTDGGAWQVTEERKTALRFSISGEMSPTCSCKYCKDAIATIWAMLRGTE